MTFQSARQAAPPAAPPTNQTNAMNPQALQRIFESALNWNDYLATDPSKAGSWQAVYEQAELSDRQRELITGFTRRVNMLCISGIWCGDCSQQGPLLQRIADANECLDLRWIDRDSCGDLSEQLMINAGRRVPVVVFMAEDFEPVSVYGDRTLSRYRAMAARNLGPSCPLPGAPIASDELAATMQDWLDEVERVHLLLRLSARLRERHGD